MRGTAERSWRLQLLLELWVRAGDVPTRKGHSMNRWALLTLPLAALACTETVESSDIRTSGVYPEFRVVADGSGTSEASARLKVGGNDSNTFLDLQAGDRIEVSANGETRVLNSESDHRYSAR